MKVFLCPLVNNWFYIRHLQPVENADENGRFTMQRSWVWLRLVLNSSCQRADAVQGRKVKPNILYI
jgi:hypothetical protein